MCVRRSLETRLEFECTGQLFYIVISQFVRMFTHVLSAVVKQFCIVSYTREEGILCLKWGAHLSSWSALHGEGFHSGFMLWVDIHQCIIFRMFRVTSVRRISWSLACTVQKQYWQKQSSPTIDLQWYVNLSLQKLFKAFSKLRMLRGNRFSFPLHSFRMNN